MIAGDEVTKFKIAHDVANIIHIEHPDQSFDDNVPLKSKMPGLGNKSIDNLFSHNSQNRSQSVLGYEFSS